MTAAHALAPPKRRPLHSTAKADAIIAAVAERHGLAPARLLEQWGGRIVTDAKREAACRLEHELQWTERMIAGHMRCALSTAQRLLRTGRERYVSAELRRTGVIPKCPEELRSEVIELRAQLERITGVHLAYRLTVAYDLRPACGVLLAILAEAYPRPMHTGSLIEAYDAACDRLEFGTRRGVADELIGSLVWQMRKRFGELQLPDPVESMPISARRLSDSAAELFRARFGVPRIAQAQVVR